ASRCQPHLAEALWRRDRAQRRLLRHARRTALPPRIARSSRDPLHPRWLVAKAPYPRARADARLSHEQRPRCRGGAAGPGESPALAHEPPEARRRGIARRHARRQRRVEARRWRTKSALGVSGEFFGPEAAGRQSTDLRTAQV